MHYLCDSLYFEKKARRHLQDQNEATEDNKQIADKCKRELQDKIDKMVEKGINKDEYAVHNVPYASEEIRNYLPTLKQKYELDNIILEWNETESNLWETAGCIGHKWTLHVRKLDPTIVQLKEQISILQEALDRPGNIGCKIGWEQFKEAMNTIPV